METNDLSPDERKAFDSLPRQAVPPDSLEREVIQSLRDKNLIQSEAPSVIGLLKYGIAASLIFLLGFATSMLIESTATTESTYIMLLYEDENFHIGNSSDVAQEYGQWAEQVNQSGIKITGQELVNEGLEISNEKVEVLDANYSNRVTGYFVMNVASESEALEIAKAHPHIKYGGKIQLKQYRMR